MKSTAVITIGFAIIVGIYITLSLMGIQTKALWVLLYPLLLAAIHLVSACFLFKETESRELREEEVFMGLDPLFWGMVGLAFGILGMIAFRLLNDHFTIDKTD